MTTVMTIDPGANGTGYAIWSRTWHLLEHGVFKSKKNTWEEVAPDLTAMVARKRFEKKVTDVYIEMPAYFQMGKGQVTASSGALVKLVMIVGMMTNECHRFARVHHVRVIDWKGQLPKDVVIRRIKKILPYCQAKSHDWDAIGIGLYVAGRF